MPGSVLPKKLGREAPPLRKRGLSDEENCWTHVVLVWVCHDSLVGMFRIETRTTSVEIFNIEPKQALHYSRSQKVGI